MTSHISGEGSYVECDVYHVVSVTPYSDFSENVRPANDCYCGDDAVQIARVGFTHYKHPPEERGVWPESLTESLKAHRCDEHGFEESN